MKYSYRSRKACYRDFYFTMEECRDCYYLTKCIEQEHGDIENDIISMTRQLSELKEEMNVFKGAVINYNHDYDRIRDVRKGLLELNQVVKGIVFDLNKEGYLTAYTYIHYRDRLQENEEKLNGVPKEHTKKKIYYVEDGRLVEDLGGEKTVGERRDGINDTQHQTDSKPPKPNWKKQDDYRFKKIYTQKVLDSKIKEALSESQEDSKLLSENKKPEDIYADFVKHYEGYWIKKYNNIVSEFIENWKQMMHILNSEGVWDDFEPESFKWIHDIEKKLKEKLE